VLAFHRKTREGIRVTNSEKRRASERAQRLLLEQLANGPRPGSQLEAAAEAAAIPESVLIAAADALGVRTQRGQWWLPG